MERIYIRGSDDRINTDNQLSELRRCSPDGIVYEDVMSGSKKRKQLERLIAESQRGDDVWIWSLDRLTREGIHATLDYLNRLTAKGVRVRSLKESWLDSENPCYEILVSCMAFAAKMERAKLIERTVTGLKHSRSIGVSKKTGEEFKAEWRRKRPKELDKKAIAFAEGTLREVAERFGCTNPYVWKCRKDFGRA